MNFYKRSGRQTVQRFCLKHTFRAGAVVWVKHKSQDYYLVFRSISRPNRGIQLPGGRVERRENISQTVIREVKEETGLNTKILCPLGFMHIHKPEDSYSNHQIYYIVKPVNAINIYDKWKYIDQDNNHQQVQCWFVPVSTPLDFLAHGQDKIIKMFREWLEEHKRPTYRMSSFN